MTTNSSPDISRVLQAPLQLEEILDELTFAAYCVVATGTVSMGYSVSDSTRRINWDRQAWLWESLNSIDEDVALFQRFPISLTQVIYILAKWVAFYMLRNIDADQCLSTYTNRVTGFTFLLSAVVFAGACLVWKKLS